MKSLKIFSILAFLALTANANAGFDIGFTGEDQTVLKAAGDPKTVVVSPYIKRNGTIVAPHTRSLPRKGF